MKDRTTNWHIPLNPGYRIIVLPNSIHNNYQHTKRGLTKTSLSVLSAAILLFLVSWALYYNLLCDTIMCRSHVSIAKYIQYAVAQAPEPDFTEPPIAERIQPPPGLGVEREQLQPTPHVEKIEPGPFTPPIQEDDDNDGGKKDDNDGGKKDDNDGGKKDDNDGGGAQSDQPTAVSNSGCLIATAAFGSELSPQVQFLRNFRDNRILSTVSGSSFMNVFNAWYYSFSPSVADYERERPWLQGAIRMASYPLLGILQVSEKSYFVLPGEYGSILSGLTASSLIGLVYLTPFALCIRRLRRNGKSFFKIYAIIIATVTTGILVALLINSNVALMITTSLFVVTLCAISAITGARMIGLGLELSRHWSFSKRTYDYLINRVKR